VTRPQLKQWGRDTVVDIKRLSSFLSSSVLPNDVIQTIASERPRSALFRAEFAFTVLALL
jgi:hypothetical protein